MKLTEEQQKIFDKITTKPLWMKNAELCERGWRNPETGELLLGRRTPKWVLDILEEQQKPKTKKQEKVKEPVVEPEKEEVQQEQPKAEVEAVKEEVIEEEKPAPKKTTRRRKKATDK